VAISRLQILLVGLLLALAIALAIPAMHNANLVRWMRGECKLLPGGRYAHFSCQPLSRSN
jgi:hypothetical protein